MPLDSITTRIANATAEIIVGEGFFETFRIPMLGVTSSNVEQIGYDGEARRLYVKFKRGSTYRYDAVPNAIFEALLQADEDGESVGATFNRLVKRGGFRYVRL